ncbi:UDP-N-acetylmuramate--L-alanine ligase [bacterium BMS3Abin14]|nr:UDP-N-acetylmuramate--L-alanine ligase [bacterium BMS3Abin14]
MVKLRKTRNLHFVGIGGIGMSGIAEVLLNLGYVVSGSDLAAGETTERLTELGARVLKGHSAENIGTPDVVIISSAIREDNPEVVAAREAGIPVVARAAMLNELMRMKYGIAVAGSHGKTSTTSMVAAVMAEANLDPTVVIGGKLNSLGINALLGTGDYLVAEADESDGSFLQLTPTIAVVTNIDREHMDHYGTMDDLRDAFRQFLLKVPFYGRAILCLDDPEVAGLLLGIDRPYLTYGLTTQANVMARDVVHSGFESSFSAELDGAPLGAVTLRVPGAHNVYNSLAAIAVGLELDIPFHTISRALGSFTGVQRRFQFKGMAAGIAVYDDYGHHPTEIKATLKAAREGWEGPIVVLFQPHRYSRTQDLLGDFGTAFHNADRVLVCDIYAAGETVIEGLTGEKVAAMMVGHGHRYVKYVGTRAEAVDRVLEEIRKGELLLTLGAGDVWRAGEEVLSRLEDQE